MSSDAAFVDDLERAARGLRAAASAALLAGLDPQQIARIVAGGIGDMQHFPAVTRSRSRVAALGYVPSEGQPLPLPDVPQDWVWSGDGHGSPDDDDFRPPSIHPCVKHTRAA